MCPKRWANEREIYVVVCWIAKFIFHKIEYVNLNTNQLQQSQCMLFCFRSLFLRFVSLALSVLFVVIVFVRSHFCNLISRLRLAIIVHSYVQHNIYAILHVQCTLYDPSSAIDWQNDQFLMCTSLSAINAIVVAVVAFSVRHSFVRTIIWLNRIEQTENLLKEFMILRLITDWALFWVNDFYSHVIHILW